MSDSERKLPVSPSVESLRKQAKHLRKAFLDGEVGARARIAAVLNRTSTTFSLREAQQVVAREYGYSTWIELRRAAEDALAKTGRSERTFDPTAAAELFLDLACLTYSDQESPRRVARAARLFAEHPEIAHDNPFVLAAIGDRNGLGALLDKADSARTVATEIEGQSRAATANPCAVMAGGPRAWPPLLYLCYSRVPQKEPLGTLELLLDHGADPNAFYMWPEPIGPNKYTALTGVFGRGEAGCIAEPPHPEQRALARLLLQRGADPNDGQTLYQCHFDADDTFLEVLFEAGLDVKSIEPWMLANAAAKGYEHRVALLLAHGFDPNSEDRAGRSAFENSVLYGHDANRCQLLAAGAIEVPLSLSDSFRAACFRGDIKHARVLAQEHPELLKEAGLLLDAALVGNLSAVRTLLDLGMSPGIGDKHGRTALHQAGNCGHLEVVKELLARGAPVDVRESYHNGTPAGFADHGGYLEIAELILAHSKDALDVVYHGNVLRLKQLLAENPAVLSVRDRHGQSALHYVDSNRPGAADLVRFLIENDVPLDTINEWGETALARFLRVGSEDLADLMIEAGASE